MAPSPHNVTSHANLPSLDVDHTPEDKLKCLFGETGQRLLSPQNSSFAPADAAQLLAELLNVTHTMVLRPVPPGNALLMQGGVGWQKDMVGRKMFLSDDDSMMSFCLANEEAISSEDLRQDSRFAISKEFQDADLKSAICLRFPFQDQSFGVVAGFSQADRSFNEQDVLCLRLVASMLVASLSRQRVASYRAVDQEKITQAKLEWEVTVDALPHFICLLDDQMRIIRANRSVDRWVPRHVKDVRGYTIHELLHPECEDPACYLTTFSALALIELLGGRSVEYETEDKVVKRYLNIQLRQTSSHMKSEAKNTSFAVALIHDVSSLKQAEEVLKSYNEQLEKRIQQRTIELLQTNEQLRRSENEMRLMSEQLLTAQEMERKRIAAELHDGIGQTLTAIKFSMENAINQCTSQCTKNEMSRFDAIITMMRGAVDEVRKISMDLHPSTLTDLGLLPTIAWFCREFRGIYTNIHLDTYIDLEEQDVPTPLKTVIFRIMQEALNNIVKHAKATSARVNLRVHEHNIELLVQDNGVGFDPKKLAVREVTDKGFGITGMRERAEFSGGSFKIESNDGKGSVIAVTWPMECEAK